MLAEIFYSVKYTNSLLYRKAETKNYLIIIIIMPSSSSTSSSDDAKNKHGVNEQKYSFRLHQRVITPTHPTEGDYISLNSEQFLVSLVLVFMAYKAFKSFRELKSFLKLLRRPGGDARVTHRKYNSEEDEDGFGIVLDEDEDGDEGETKLD